MGVYEKTGVRNIALQVVDLINWIRLYGFKKGFAVFRALITKKNNVYVLKNKLFPQPLTLRDNYSDRAIFKQVFLERQYDIPQLTELTNVARIIDGGGNVGLAARYFTTLFPRAEIVSIEPESNNFEILKQNTAAFPVITCLKAGIWYQREDIHVGNPEAMAGSFSIAPGAGEGNVLHGITIDSIMEQRNWDYVDIVKLDIEGAEKEVFSQNNEWLSKTRLLIIEIHDRYKEGCAKAVFNAINKYDYEAHFHHENAFIFINKNG